MPNYPSDANDTVLYTGEDIYVPKDSSVTVFEDSRMFLFGEWYLNGSPLGGGGTALNAKDFGAKGDGIQNDAPFIQNALNQGAATGMAVVLPAGEYKLNSYLTLQSGNQLIGVGKVILRYNAATTGNEAVWAAGTEGAQTPLTTNQLKDSWNINLPTGAGAGFVEDDIIGLISMANVDTDVDQGFAHPREIFQVIKVTGDVIQVDHRLEFDYNVADTGAYFKITPCIDPVVKGIIFHTLTLTGDINKYSMRADYCLRGQFDFVTWNGSGFRMKDCIFTKVNAQINGEKNYPNPVCYGVSVGNSSYGVEVDIIGNACRHLFTTSYNTNGVDTRWSGPFSTTVRGIGYGSYESGAVFDTHMHCYDTLFLGCQAYGPGVYGFTGAFQDRGHRTRFVGCKGRDSKYAIWIRPDSTDCVIENCHLSGEGTDATAVIMCEGKNLHVLGGSLVASGPSRGIRMAPGAFGTLLKGVDITGDVAPIHDDLANDTGALVENCLFHIGTSYTFLTYVGVERNNTLAPNSLSPFAQVGVGNAWKNPSRTNTSDQRNWVQPYPPALPAPGATWMESISGHMAMWSGTIWRPISPTAADLNICCVLGKHSVVLSAAQNAGNARWVSMGNTFAISGVQNANYLTGPARLGFNGTTAFCEFSPWTDYQFSVGQSFTAWVVSNMATAATQQWFGVKGNAAAAGVGWSLGRTSTANTISLRVSDGTNQPAVSAAITPLAYNHILGIRDVGATQLRLWANNTLVATVADSTTGTLDSGGPLTVCRTSSGTVSYYPGEILAAGVYRGVLTTTEMTTLQSWVTSISV